MAFDITSFINFTRSKLAICVANKAILITEGYGDVPLDLIQKDNSTHTIILREVWYVPQLSCNLISTKALGLDGITTVFEYATKSFLLKDREVLGMIDSANRKYWLRLTR
jgi:hypothetical protein